MSRLNHQIADAILKSPYFVAAEGCRDVGHDELYQIIKAIKNTSKLNVDGLLDELKAIEKHSPASIFCHEGSDGKGGAMNPSNCSKRDRAEWAKCTGR